MGSDTGQDTENQVRILRGVVLILCRVFLSSSDHYLTTDLYTLHSTGVSYLVDIVDIVFWVGEWF